jgi:hypothetical protein
LVPLSDLTLTPVGRRAASTAGELVKSEGAGSALEAQRWAERVLPQLAQDIRRGRYIDAVARGSALLGENEGESLTEPQRAEVYRWLTEAYVALDARPAAARACTMWRQLDEHSELDPVEFSPKILSACVGEIGPDEEP